MNQANHVDGTRLGALISMTWPMLLGVLSLMSFQLVDSIFISRLGVDALAVVGFTIPIYQVIIGIQVGIGIATTALISQRLGSNNADAARSLGGTLFIFGALIIAIVCVGLWFFRAEVLAIMDGEAKLVPVLSELWTVWLPSAFIGAILYFGYSICRAHGNTLLPGALMVATSLLNMALDPVFIFTLDMGLIGAPTATVVSFGLGLCIVFPQILRRHWMSLVKQSDELRHQISDCLNIALPAMVGQLMPALAAIIATGMIADFGTTAVAAWGLGIRIEFFGLVLVLALTMSMPPMVGRQFGAGNFSAISALIKLGVKLIVGVQLGLALMLAAFAEPLAVFMADSEDVAELVAAYLWIMPISYTSLGVCILMVSMSNAISQSLRAVLISSVRLFACYLPFLYLGAKLYGFEGAVAGGAIGNVCAGIVAWFMFRAGIKKASS